MSKHRPEHEAEEGKTAELLTHPSMEELMQKLGEAEQKANENWDRLLRLQAEKDNMERRVERDVANAHKYGLEKFANELLPIVDSLELSTTHNKEGDEHTKAVIEGVNMTLKMFYAALEKFGVKQVNPVGEPFDPEFQQAISMQVDPNVKVGTVISVLQKGYTLNNRLLRPALVVVSKSE
jgi:molecular chaperone GrpE